MRCGLFVLLASASAEQHQELGLPGEDALSLVQLRARAVQADAVAALQSISLQAEQDAAEFRGETLAGAGSDALAERLANAQQLHQLLGTAERLEQEAASAEAKAAAGEMVKAAVAALAELQESERNSAASVVAEKSNDTNFAEEVANATKVVEVQLESDLRSRSRGKHMKQSKAAHDHARAVSEASAASMEVGDTERDMAGPPITQGQEELTVREAQSETSNFANEEEDLEESTQVTEDGWPIRLVGMVPHDEAIEARSKEAALGSIAMLEEAVEKSQPASKSSMEEKMEAAIGSAVKTAAQDVVRAAVRKMVDAAAPQDLAHAPEVKTASQDAPFAAASGAQDEQRERVREDIHTAKAADDAAQPTEERATSADAKAAARFLKAAAVALRELEEETAVKSREEKSAEVEATVVAEDRTWAKAAASSADVGESANSQEDFARAKAFAAEKLMLAKAEALKAQKEQRELEEADVEARKLKQKAYTLSRREKQAELNAMRDIKQAEEEMARFTGPATSQDSASEEFYLKRLSVAPEHAAPFPTHPKLVAVGASEASPSGGTLSRAAKDVKLMAETGGLGEAQDHEVDASQAVLTARIQKAKAAGAAAARAQQAAREALRLATEASARSEEQLQNAEEAAAEQDANDWSSIVKEARAGMQILHNQEMETLAVK